MGTKLFVVDFYVWNFRLHAFGDLVVTLMTVSIIKISGFVTVVTVATLNLVIDNFVFVFVSSVGLRGVFLCTACILFGPFSVSMALFAIEVANLVVEKLTEPVAVIFVTVTSDGFPTVSAIDFLGLNIYVVAFACLREEGLYFAGNSPEMLTWRM
uniref:Uncharacterized protein n=1 Tax=Glossina brevipalpis TaxID=37001 RepID=A0A1A9WCT5_9MUSC